MVVCITFGYEINVKTRFLLDKCKFTMGKEMTREYNFCNSWSSSILLSWSWKRWKDLELFSGMGDQLPLSNQHNDLRKRSPACYCWLRLWQSSCLQHRRKSKRSCHRTTRSLRAQATHKMSDGTLTRLRTLISHFYWGRRIPDNHRHQYQRTPPFSTS